MNSLNVKKGDTVVVISGKDKGKKGKIMVAQPDDERVIVQGAAMVTRHVKPRKQGQPGGRIEKEGPIHASNVMLVCPKCDKPTRIAHKLKEVEISGEKKQKSVRVCKKCGKVID
ncbi:MAG TPA: 50S ribosomal protein L24 [Clostridia bacterium]|jgi:large subunit ribosomal protein L24|nr:50S ribosomal protein L24 [Clostridia bacterium]